MRPANELAPRPARAAGDVAGGGIAAGAHLAIAFGGFVVLGMAELFGFAEMGALATRLGGARAALVAAVGGSFLFFTFLALIGMTLSDYVSRAWGRW